MSQQSEVLKERSMSFAVNVLRLVNGFPPTVVGDVVARQLAKSATSVAANYRSVCTARSRRDFIAKLAIVVEESEETVCWLDIVARVEIVRTADLAALHREASELRAIFSRSLGTARMNNRIVSEMTK